MKPNAQLTKMTFSLKDNPTTLQTRTTIPHRGMGVSGTDVLITEINKKRPLIMI